jgi:hypothetical protein
MRTAFRADFVDMLDSSLHCPAVMAALDVGASQLAGY